MAGFIPDDKIIELKNTADIVGVISDHVALKKTGHTFKGLCPFHAEKTPSFTVSPDKQIFHCFGCGAGGDVIKFVQEREGLSFVEAAKMLANRFGVALPLGVSPEKSKKERSDREKILAINTLACDFYHDNLIKRSSGKKGFDYLLKRGFSEQILRDFKLGYAQPGWDNLLQFFKKKNVPTPLAEKAGLIILKTAGGYYDRFRERVIFPIPDNTGSIIGFGGRVLDDSLPKYLNSPETPVYNKSKSLYGLFAAKQIIREKKSVFIVEGYLDAIALHSHGIGNAVATLGTALTPDHVRMLNNLSAENMFLVYDSDAAGIRAAEKCVDVFFKEHMNFSRRDVYTKGDADTKILILPDGYDPDTYIKEFGKQAFEAEAEKALDAVTFLVETAIKRHGLTPQGKIKIIADLSGPLSMIDDSIARSIYVKEIAERTGVGHDAVLQGVRKAAGKPGRTSSVEEMDQREALPLAVDRTEKQILEMMLQCPDIIPDVEARGIAGLLEDNTVKLAVDTVTACYREGDFDPSRLVSTVNNEGVSRLITSVYLKEDQAGQWTDKVCKRLLNQFETAKSKKKRTELDKEIRKAEASQDHERWTGLMAEKQKLAEKFEKRKMGF